MSVYKELGYAVREIESKSKRIYADACDYGVPVFSKDDAIIKLVKNQILPYCDNKVKTTKYAGGATQTMIFAGDYASVVEAGFERMILSFVTIRNSKDGMIGYIVVTKSTPPEARRKANKYIMGEY